MNIRFFLLVCAAALLAGCQTNAPYGEPVRTINNPFQPQQYGSMVDQYRVKGELWRGDAMAVCQIELYKIEGKSAVLLDQKLIAREDEGTKQIIEVTTRKNIYWFRLSKPTFASSVWWIDSVEVFKLPSEDPAENPALKTNPAPIMRQPTGLSPVENRESETQEPSAP